MSVTYSVIGLGKLGASMVAAIAKRGFTVTGVDVNPRSVELLASGHAPVSETDLESTIAANSQRIRATMSFRDAVLGSDVTFVIVPTPSDSRGAFSLDYATAAFREIGRALAEKSGYHLVVMTSTVLPGATRYGLIPVLEAESGKTAGVDFGVCYSPEFIALGSVIRDFLNPDFTLVGELDERSGTMLESCYSAIMENRPPCKRMSIENAELTKISVNTYVTMKIAFANMIADLCERIPGGDVDVVTNALGADSRIGRKYLTGALGYGGPCFPRDNVAMGFMARALGSAATLAEATDASNRSLANRYVEVLRDDVITPSMTVAVLGLAYKPHSHVIEESQGLALAKTLAKSGVKVVAYDPLANEGARAAAPEVTVVDSLQDCLSDADVVIVTTPDPEFQRIRIEQILKSDKVVTVVDFWRILSQTLMNQPGVRYVAAGRGRSVEDDTERLRSLWSQDTGVAASG